MKTPRILRIYSSQADLDKSPEVDATKIVATKTADMTPFIGESFQAVYPASDVPKEVLMCFNRGTVVGFPQ